VQTACIFNSYINACTSYFYMLGKSTLRCECSFPLGLDPDLGILIYSIIHAYYDISCIILMYCL